MSNEQNERGKRTEDGGSDTPLYRNEFNLADHNDTLRGYGETFPEYDGPRQKGPVRLINLGL